MASLSVLIFCHKRNNKEKGQRIIIDMKKYAPMYTWIYYSMTDFEIDFLQTDFGAVFFLAALISSVVIAPIINYYTSLERERNGLQLDGVFFSIALVLEEYESAENGKKKLFGAYSFVANLQKKYMQIWKKLLSDL